MMGRTILNPHRSRRRPSRRTEQEGDQHRNDNLHDPSLSSPWERREWASAGRLWKRHVGGDGNEHVLAFSNGLACSHEKGSVNHLRYPPDRRAGPPRIRRPPAFVLPSSCRTGSEAADSPCCATKKFSTYWRARCISVSIPARSVSEKCEHAPSKQGAT